MPHSLPLSRGWYHDRTRQLNPDDSASAAGNAKSGQATEVRLPASGCFENAILCTITNEAGCSLDPDRTMPQS